MLQSKSRKCPILEREANRGQFACIWFECLTSTTEVMVLSLRSTHQCALLIWGSWTGAGPSTISSGATWSEQMSQESTNTGSVISCCYSNTLQEATGLSTIWISIDLDLSITHLNDVRYWLSWMVLRGDLAVWKKKFENSLFCWKSWEQ